MCTLNLFITGASRGLGLEVVRQLLKNHENRVIAACRDPARAPGLQGLKTDKKLGENLHIVQLDTGSEDSIRASVAVVANILGEEGLDVLYNNAAITEGDDSAFDFSYDGFLKELQVNVAGPALIGQLYLPFLEKGKRKVIVNVTSGLASIGLDFGAKNATYSISKTALNMLAYKQAKARPDIISIVIDPGWVKTDMGGPNALTEPEESISSVLKVVTNLTPGDSGKFFRHDGEVVVW